MLVSVHFQGAKRKRSKNNGEFGSLLGEGCVLLYHRTSERTKNNIKIRYSRTSEDVFYSSVRAKVHVCVALRKVCNLRNIGQQLERLDSKRLLLCMVVTPI